MRKTVELEALTQAYHDYEELLYKRMQAALETDTNFKGIDPETYYNLVQKGAFSLLKEARRLAGYK